MKFVLILFSVIFFNLLAFAGELNITASKMDIDKEKEIINAEGSVVATDDLGNKIEADRAKYSKKEGILKGEGSVVVTDNNENIITTDRIKYLEQQKIIYTYENSKVNLNNGYEISSNSLVYDTINKIVKSNEYSNLIDLDGNFVEVNMFEYSFIKKIFSSKGDIKIVDDLENEYFFEEIYVHTKDRKIVGSKVRVSLNPKSVERATEENEPRFVANTAIITKNKSFFKKGVYTQCKREKDKCPAWALQAKTITHDKLKKNIYYDNSTLKIYDIPVFYFPKFFHPDPTVKRQSGFLSPTMMDSSTLGLGLNLPYFFALADDKDLTFTPQIYSDEYNLYLGEYRQVTENSSLTIDAGYTKGYSAPSGNRTPGSRNHIFLESQINLDFDYFEESTLDLALQRASNDTYLRIYNINTLEDTGLVDFNDTTLDNTLELNLKKQNMLFNFKSSAHENLRQSGNSRYEFMAPEINFENLLYESEKIGTINWKSTAFYRNYEVNKQNSLLTNDLLWSSNEMINKNGFVTEIEGILKNTNYDAKNTSQYKNEKANHEIAGVLGVTRSLPMEKRSNKNIKTFSPKIMLRFAPGHMRNLSDDGITFTSNNLFSINKTSHVDVIDSGTSAIIGFDFKIDDIIDDVELTDKITNKLSISAGQIFNIEKNDDMPTTTSLDQKISDLVGEINYNLIPNNTINYKFSLDENLSTFNYHEITGNFNFGKIDFNINYLEEHNHIGNANYVNNEIIINFNENNSLNFKTRKNFQTSGTEFYNLNYQYENDCLKAGVQFKREFYADRDVEPTDTLRFTIAIIPYTQIDAPIDQSLFK